MEIQIVLHKAAGGSPMDYNRVSVLDRKPTVAEVRAAADKAGVDMSAYSDAEIQSVIDGVAAMSLPDGKIYVPEGARDTQERLNALTVHEVEHQSQYQNGDAGEVFKKLVDEAQMVPANGDDDPYKTPGYKEYDAQQVEEKAKDLYKNGWTPPTTGGKNK